MKKTIAVYLIVFIGFAAYAQAATNTQPIIVTNWQSAAAALIHFIFPSVTPVQAAMGLYLVAKILRKAIPDKMQASQLGVWLAHTALEVNPTVQKLADAVPPQTGK